MRTMSISVLSLHIQSTDCLREVAVVVEARLATEMELWQG